MFLGYTPELTQVIYRVGDSVTNIISPMMSFFALIIAFIQKYEKKAGIGTVIATMLPYTFAFFVVWTILLIIGLLWIVVYYVAGADIPGVSTLGNWNLMVGMGLVVAGFLVFTRWK